MADEAIASGADQDTGADDTEARARVMGWVPKDEFKGNAARWTDAKTWIARTENEMPVLRGTLSRLERDNRDLRGKLDETSQTVGEIRDFYAASEERAYNRAKRELDARMREKAAAADVDGVAQVQREIEELPKPPPKVERKAEERPQIDPAVPAWVNAPEQAWYRDDVNMQAEAQAIHSALTKTRPDLNMSQNLAEVRRRMALTYPEKFSNPKREEPAAVSEPRGGGPRRSNGRTFDDLPADAKAAYERFAKVMPGYKKEDYLAAYQWD